MTESFIRTATTGEVGVAEYRRVRTGEAWELSGAVDEWMHVRSTLAAASGPRPPAGTFWV